MEVNNQMHCPLCKSENLTEEGPITMFNVRFRTEETGLLGPKYINAWANRARVCIDCGYLLAFVREEDVKRLKEREAKKVT